MHCEAMGALMSYFMTLIIELGQELDGQWYAYAPRVHGEPSVYGATKEEALANLVELMRELPRWD